MQDLMIELIAGLASLSLPGFFLITVALPSVILALVGRIVRLACGVAGLVVFIGTLYAVDLGGPDSVLLVVPLLGLLLAFSAVAAELASALVGNWRRRAAKAPDANGGHDG